MRPAQHYSMGGIRTDAHCHSQRLRGLFAVGEAACWDMHGFNRLGGNSVAETVVAGMIAGETIADFCDSPEGQMTISTTLARDAVKAQALQLRQLAECEGDENAVDLVRAMQETMTARVGIFRDGDSLDEAVATLRELQRRARHIRLGSTAPGPNPELVAAYRLPRMLKLALCVACGAQQRTESRGAHYRADFPRRDDSQWLTRTLASWPEPGDELPTLAYEPLDVMSMELPPGWRGYGARDFIEHPDSSLRQAQIEELLAGAHGVDAAARQDLLMPFRHLLPPGLRGANQRLGDTP